MLFINNFTKFMIKLHIADGNKVVKWLISEKNQVYRLNYIKIMFYISQTSVIIMLIFGQLVLINFNFLHFMKYNFKIF